MQVLIKPLLTEKATEMNENGVYVFIVDKNANKIQIKTAVEEKYSVNVASVRTAITPGKSKKRYTKSSVVSGKTSAVKKAMITLAEGEIIDIYENM